MRFRITLRALKAFAGMAAFLFTFATLLPAEVYQYTGLNYATVNTGLTYTTSESVSATFTFADPLAANQTTPFAATATSWSIFDGVNAFCDSCGDNLVSLVFATDSMGNISDWYFDVTNDAAGVEVFSGGPSGGGIGAVNTDTATTGSDFGTSTTAGSWQDTTPEPGTLGMMLAGSLLLFGLRRRRAAKATV